SGVPFAGDHQHPINLPTSARHLCRDASNERRPCCCAQGGALCRVVELSTRQLRARTVNVQGNRQAGGQDGLPPDLPQESLGVLCVSLSLWSRLHSQYHMMSARVAVLHARKYLCSPCCVQVLIHGFCTRAPTPVLLLIFGWTRRGGDLLEAMPGLQ